MATMKFQVVVRVQWGVESPVGVGSRPDRVRCRREARAIEMRRIAWSWCALALLLAACHKKPPADDAQAVLGAASDAVKEQAMKDLQNDILLLRTQLAIINGAPPPNAPRPPAAVQAARVNAALYTCERLAIASKELSDDARMQATLGEADSLCAYQAPLAAGELKLAALESARGAEPTLKSAPVECGPIRDALNRVGAKYKTDAKLAELVKRFKAECPRMRLGAARPERASSGGGGGGGGGGVNRDAQRSDCKRRCDDASFDCRSRCQYCGSCTSDKTWEWCNATCNNCKQGCEQNERFCQAGCGG